MEVGARGTSDQTRPDPSRLVPGERAWTTWTTRCPPVARYPVEEGRHRRCCGTMYPYLREGSSNTQGSKPAKRAEQCANFGLSSPGRKARGYKDPIRSVRSVLGERAPRDEKMEIPRQACLLGLDGWEDGRRCSAGGIAGWIRAG